MPPCDRRNVNIEPTEAGVVAHLIDCAALNEQTTPAVKAQLLEVAAEIGGGRLLLDLGGVHYASSIALAMLIGLHHKLRDASGHFAVREVNDEIYEVIDVTGLTRFIDIQRKSCT